MFTEIKMDKEIPLIVEVLTVIILLDCLPPIHKHLRRLVFVGIRIIVSKFDVNDGLGLSIP